MKGLIITSTIVVLFLALCSWRIERLDEKGDIDSNTLVVNVK
jgi:hypothetical protein